MPRAITFVVVLLLAGCTNLKPWQQVAIGVLVVGAIAAHDDDGDHGQVFQNRTPTPNVDCAANPQSCR